MNDILKYKDYYASVHFSGADEVLHGKILGINDLVNFEGKSVAGLKAAFKEAVDDYLDTCAALGKSPDKTYKGSFNVRVPASLHKDAALVASALNITLNELVKKALSLALSQRDKLQNSDELEPA